MTKRLDPEVKETRRRYRMAAKLANAIGIPPQVALDLAEVGLALREELGEEAAMRILMGEGAR